MKNKAMRKPESGNAIASSSRKTILPAVKAIYRAEKADTALLRLKEYEAAWG